MESLLAAIEATGPAQYLRVSRLGYAAVSGAHILGIAFLVGAILPLNLRLLGFWPSIPAQICSAFWSRLPPPASSSPR